MAAKVRISEQNTKGKLVFLCIFERKYLLATRKVTNKRAKSKKTLYFLAVSPKKLTFAPENKT